MKIKVILLYYRLFYKQWKKNKKYDKILCKEVDVMSEVITKKQAIKNCLYRMVLIFTIGCFLGCIFETILCYFQRGHFESRRGLIYGPFNPVYGFGIVTIAFVLERYKKNSSLIISGALLGGSIEYICSWFQETVFKTRSWNYTNYFLNFNGRTSLYHMIWWGILSFIFIKIVYPQIIKIIYKVKEQKRFIISIIICIFFILDMMISGAACIRQQERLNGVRATNTIQKFLDIHYPDKRLIKIYPNLRDAKTNIKISKMK